MKAFIHNDRIEVGSNIRSINKVSFSIRGYLAQDSKLCVVKLILVSLTLYVMYTNSNLRLKYNI